MQMMSHSSEKFPSKHTHQGDQDEEHSNYRMSPLPVCSSSNKSQQQQESCPNSNCPQQEQIPDIVTSSRGNRLKDEAPSNHQSFGSLQKSAQENVLNSQSDNHQKEQQLSSVGNSSTHKNSEEHGNVAVQNAPKYVFSTTASKNVDAGLERTNPSSSSDCCCPCCCIS